MLNFLPHKNKNQIIIEYVLRAVVLLLIFIFISSIFLISLFAPSFFFVNYKNNTLNNQLTATKQADVSKEADPIVFIKDLNRLATALADSNMGVNYTDIVNKIISLKNKDIKISSISINSDPTTNSKKIMVNGVANTRDSLTSYEKELKIDGFFESVDFPVSNFIKSSNSDFSATLVYKYK